MGNSTSDSDTVLHSNFFQSSISCICILDRNGQILQPNPALCKVFGYEETELIGEPFTNLASDEEISRLQSSLNRLGKNSSSLELQVRCRAKDGKLRTLLWSIWLNDAQDQIHCTGKIFFDESQAKLNERQIDFEKMETIRRLAGGVSHYYSNLLMAISGYADLIFQTLPDDSPIRPMAEEICAASEKARNITRQLLAYSRKQVTQPRILNLNETIEQTVPMLDKMIGEDIQVQCKLQDGSFDIEFDPGQLDQIFLTLAANARDAMPRGGTLTIETGVFVVKQELAGRFHLPPGAYVELQVSDSGVGMDEATSSQIFEPFFTTKDEGRGAGLGLATLLSIVKQEGGDIQVFSTPGTGTTVKIYLPAVSSDGKELTVVTPKTGPETILVLEDEPMVLRFLLRALERKKYRVVACSDIDEARVKFEEMGREIDLILTDVVLPKGSGPEFIRDLRSQVPGLKVLFMTGHTEHELVDPLAYEGGRGPLEKPILMEELFARVRESLDSSFE